MRYLCPIGFLRVKRRLCRRGSTPDGIWKFEYSPRSQGTSIPDTFRLGCTMYIPSDTSLVSSSFVDSSDPAASVICSWPLSGQYGPGARMLYYVLVIICVAAPHIAWMRGACLAAALLFPAVAAIHALVLASVSETHGMCNPRCDQCKLAERFFLSQVLSIWIYSVLSSSVRLECWQYLSLFDIPKRILKLKAGISCSPGWFSTWLVRMN